MLARLRDQAAELAVSFEGIQEDPRGSNRGPLIDKWAVRCGAKIGSPWCLIYLLGAAYLPAWEQLAHGVFEVDRTPLGQFPLPITAHVATFWHLALAKFKTDVPVPNSIAIHLVNPADPWTAGHCGIVRGGSRGYVTTVDGNTDEHGGREGHEVAQRTRPASYWHGYLDIGRGDS